MGRRPVCRKESKFTAECDHAFEPAGSVYHAWRFLQVGATARLSKSHNMDCVNSQTTIRSTETCLDRLSPISGSPAQVCGWV